MRTVVAALAMVGFLAGPALAGQCPALIKQINDGVGNRADAGAAQAKMLAKEAEDLHKAGKHADSVKKAQDAAKAAGIALKMK
jgi:hypothetical protein